MRLRLAMAGLLMAAAAATVTTAGEANSARGAAPLHYRFTSTPIVTFDRADGLLSYNVYVRLNHRLPNREVSYLR